MLMTIITAIQNITLGKILKYTFYFIVALYVGTWISVFIELMADAVKSIWMHFFNEKVTMAVERWSEKRYYNEYHENEMVESRDVVDISSILRIIPKLVVKINVFTGEVKIEDVVIKQRLTERILFPRRHSSIRRDVTLKKKEVEKEYVYCQALINSLNLRYFNWQMNNPELIRILEAEEIADRELLRRLLENFRV